MGLFKNGIGRPSNDTIRKRKTAIFLLVIAVIGIIGGATVYVTNLFKEPNSINGSSKNATVSVMAAYSGDVATDRSCKKGDGRIDYQDVFGIQDYFDGKVPYLMRDNYIDINRDGKKDKIDLKIINKLSTSKSGYNYGDVNQDGIIDKKDEDLVRKASTNKVKLNSTQFSLADVDIDGKITSSDAYIIQQVTSGYGDICTSLDYTKGDGTITDIDVNTVERFIKIKDINLTAAQKKAADVDKDGNVTNKDVELLKKKVDTIVTVTFSKNGAKKIDTTVATCHIYYKQQSCQVKTPFITPKSGFTAVGWSEDNNDTKGVAQGNKITVSDDTTYYAITRSNDVYTVDFSYDSNYISSIKYNNNTCRIYNGKDRCSVKAPTVTAKSGFSLYGWLSDDADFEISNVLTSNDITVKKSEGLYFKYNAIVKSTVSNTITFKTSGLDYFEYQTTGSDYKKNFTCVYYYLNKNNIIYDNSCGLSVRMPEFNKKGYYNQFWSEYPIGSTDLQKNNVAYKDALFIPVGKIRKYTKSVTLYPNYNNRNYFTGSSSNQFRSIAIKKSFKVGKTLYEFENGIPDSTINVFKSEMEKAYEKYNKVLFLPAKVFVMTSKTYSAYSMAYGLTRPYNNAYSIIDLQYDSSGRISINAALHELGHAWDAYYGFKTGTEIEDTKEFMNFYNSLKNNNRLAIEETKKVVADNTKNIDTNKQITLSEAKKIDANAKVGNTINIYISPSETWAAMVTNYYWHVLKVDDNENSYALRSRINSTELKTLKGIIETKISQSKGWY